MKFIFITLVSVLLVIPLYTYAKENGPYLTNINGIEISEEDYNNFLKVHTHEYIMTMDEEDYNKLKSLDYSNVKTDTKYLKTVYNPHLWLVTEEEITKEEYENPVSPMLDTDDDIIETSSKKLTLTLAGGTTWNYVVLTNTWKGSPSVRSFDVSGIRVNGASVRNGSQEGEQIYTTNGQYNRIGYSWNGTNIKRLDNGFGISMNIVNDPLESLQLSIECDIKPTDSYTYVFGSYQHAVTNVSLAESQNYTMGGSGLGSVFIYPLSISQKYDGMTGTILEY